MSSTKVDRDRRHAADANAGRSHHRVFVGQEPSASASDGAKDEIKSKGGANGTGADRKHHCPKHSTKQRVFRAIVMPASEVDGNSERSTIPVNSKDAPRKSLHLLSTPRSSDTKGGTDTGIDRFASSNDGRGKRSCRTIPENKENNTNAWQTPVEDKKVVRKPDPRELTDSDSGSDSPHWAHPELGDGSDDDRNDATKPDSVRPSRNYHRSLSTKGSVRSEVDARVRALTQEAARLQEKLEASEGKRRRCVGRVSELEAKLAERDASIAQLRFTNQSLQKELTAVAEASAATSKRNRTALASLRSGLSSVEATVAQRSAQGGQLLQALVTKLLGLQTLLLGSGPFLASRDTPAGYGAAGDFGARPMVVPQVQAILTGILQNVSQLNGVVSSGLASLSTNAATPDTNQLHDLTAATSTPQTASTPQRTGTTNHPAGGPEYSNMGHANTRDTTPSQAPWQQTPWARPERDARHLERDTGRGWDAWGPAAAGPREDWHSNAAGSHDDWQRDVVPSLASGSRVRNDQVGAAQEHSRVPDEGSSQHTHTGHWGHVSDSGRSDEYLGQAWGGPRDGTGRDGGPFSTRDKAPFSAREGSSSSQATFWPSVPPGRYDQGATSFNDHGQGYGGPNVPSMSGPGLTPQPPRGAAGSAMAFGGGGRGGGGGDGMNVGGGGSGVNAGGGGEEPMIAQLMAQLEQSEAERERLGRLLEAAHRAGDLQGAQVASLIPMYSQAIEKARSLCASLQAKLTSGMKERRVLREQLDAMEAELRDRDAQNELRRISAEQREAAHLRVATDAQMRAQELEVQLQEMKQRIHNGVDAYRALSAEHAAAQAHTVELQLKIDELQATIVEMQATIDDLRADLKSVLDMVALKKVRAAANAVSSLTLTPNTSPSKLPPQQPSPGLPTGSIPQPRSQYLPSRDATLPGGVERPSFTGFTPVKSPSRDIPVGATAGGPFPLTSWEEQRRGNSHGSGVAVATPAGGNPRDRKNKAFGQFPGSGSPAQNVGANAGRKDKGVNPSRPGAEILPDAMAPKPAGLDSLGGQAASHDGHVDNERGSQEQRLGQKVPASDADVILGQLHLDMAALDAEMTALQHSLAR
eukprot:jgi/Mesvir1/918/Mv17478-RA.1